MNFFIKKNTTAPKSLFKGYTIIELLVVISFIAILFGILLTIVNSSQSRRRAEESVKQANLSKVVEAVENYRMAEGSYPPDTGNDGNPADDGDGVVNIYIKSWPENEPPGAVYYYKSDDGSSFGISVAATAGRIYKYHSSWGEIMNCPWSDDIDNGNTTGCESL